MDLRLFSLDQAPKSLPVWESILEDLGAPAAPRIARALDVGASTVYRWNQTGTAPRMACLALFWLTRWGRSEVDARATNDAVMAVALARSLAEERNALRGRVAILSDERDRLSQLVRNFQALTAHGSGATAGHSRTGTPTADSSALEWPPLEAPQLPWPALPAPTAPRLDPASAAGRGSPATPPPAARSAKCPGPGRTAPLQPSTRPEAVPSSPSASPWRQIDATMPPLATGSFHLLKMRQAQGGRLAGSPTGGVAGATLACRARLHSALCPSLSSATAAQPSWRASTAAPGATSEPASCTTTRATAEGSDREGSPARPAVLGPAPAPGALPAPGRDVFSAMAFALAPSRATAPGPSDAALPSPPNSITS